MVPNAAHGGVRGRGQPVQGVVAQGLCAVVGVGDLRDVAPVLATTCGGLTLLA